MFRILIVTMLLATAITCSAQVPQGSQVEGGEYRQLAGEIDQILQRTGTPGAAVAMFKSDGSVWRYTTGLKDIARNEPVEFDTVFRLGSISKIFVGLAVMKLVAAGEVSLQDPIAELAPEVAFENPWEKDNPVRLIHLLNHTTGWDAPHAPELVGRTGRPVDIATTLARHPHSRHSRWVPGSRSSYNNSGPLVAAHIVEKITGVRFEDYVKAQFFDPLHMADSGYFYDDHYRSRAASLYRSGEKLPYWHLPNRAAGGMHGSLEDMIRLVRFLQNPESLDAADILPGETVRAMERPAGSRASEAGLEVGWGTGLTSFHSKGLVLYGHEGALPGARALVAYEPRGTLGHVVLTNGNSAAASLIHKQLINFSASTRVPDNAGIDPIPGTPDVTLTGFYRVISPVTERFRIANSLMPWKVAATGRGIALSPVIGGRRTELIATESGHFVQPDTGRIALVRTRDPLVGDVIHYGPMTLQSTSGLAAIAPLVLLGMWLLAVVTGLVHLLIWLVRILCRRGLSTADRRLRGWALWPVSGLIITAAGVVMITRSSDPYALAATVTVPSLMVFAGPLAFLLASLWSLRVWLRCRAQASAGFWRGHAASLILLNVIWGLYLLGHGLVATRLWA